jgi:hypothetical protein
MDYLSTAFRNSVAYFIMDMTGIVRIINNSTGNVASQSAALALTYSGINEGIDFFDNGKSNLTTGNYLRSLDGVVWNYLYILGVTMTDLGAVAAGILDSLGVPGGEIRTSVLNGIFITLANLIRELIDKQGPKQLRIATQPTSFVYSSATGNTNSYL